MGGVSAGSGTCKAEASDPGYQFPPSPSPETLEWAGTPIGTSNVITRTKGRTPLHNKSVDLTPGLRQRLWESIRSVLTEAAPHKIQELDVVIHGIRVRAVTNSPHLSDFWTENWYSVSEWEVLTGKRAPADPAVRVYAFGGVAKESEAAYYSRQYNEIVFFNTCYYGQLKSWVLGAVGRILASELGIHSIHGACVGWGEKGVLYIAPTGTGKSTSAYGLMSSPGTRFHSDDWVYIRYTCRTREGRPVYLVELIQDGASLVRGYQVHRWLEEHLPEARTSSILVRVRTLDDDEIIVSLSDLDLDGPWTAYAYTSEKVFYLRSNLVENFPETSLQLLRSKLENIPDVTGDYLAEKKESLASLAAVIDRAMDIPEAFPGLAGEDAVKTLARLCAFHNARGMLDITSVFPRERVVTNPMEPTKLTSVFLLSRNRDDRMVLNSLDQGEFLSRLLVGETPDHQREIAYNAYRVVDDSAEKSYVEKLEREMLSRRERGIQAENLYSLMDSRRDVPQTIRDVPQTLVEEFELFRVMHKAARCYELNTILGQDPGVKGGREAVLLTLALIKKVIQEEPSPIRLSLGEHRLYLDS